MSVTGGDWDVFLSPADFGETVFWETQDGEFAELDGIFENAREVVLPGEGGGVSAMMPVLVVAESAVPESAAQDDDLEIRGRNYRVADIQPDGSGLSRIVLERT